MPYIRPQKAKESFEHYISAITDQTIIEETVLDIIEESYHRQYGYVADEDEATSIELNNKLCRLIL